ncbi:MAG: glycoside hydrolase family 3 protein [bacterium]|nr:glycoside hydrolase family 3 protein [bacterium]
MKYFSLSLTLFLSFTATSQDFSLNDYLSENEKLDQIVDSIFENLSDHDRVSQLIMPAVGRYGSPEDTIEKLVREKKIGGVLLLNGTKEQFENWTSKYDQLNEESNTIPFLYSADAEPSLVNRKMMGSRMVPKANQITSSTQLTETATIISEDLNEVGVNYNFAPVVDVAKNKTVGYRGFGTNPENILPFSEEFIRVTQKHNIIATAKHFPGHGLVSGDTHKSLQIIDGELKELGNYPPLIQSGVLSIMVAHIAIQNNENYNTEDLPATLSQSVVTELLRDSLGFKGLIVTDALNMGGVVHFDNVSVRAIEAGCDILLMPVSASETHNALLKKYREQQVFEEKINSSCKRIIRMKVCLGLLDS